MLAYGRNVAMLTGRLGEAATISVDILNLVICYATIMRSSFLSMLLFRKLQDTNEVSTIALCYFRFRPVQSSIWRNLITPFTVIFFRSHGYIYPHIGGHIISAAIYIDSHNRGTVLSPSSLFFTQINGYYWDIQKSFLFVCKVLHEVKLCSKSVGHWSQYVSMLKLIQMCCWPLTFRSLQSYILFVSFWVLQDATPSFSRGKRFTYLIVSRSVSSTH